MVVSDIFYFHPYLGKLSNLTNVFKWVETTNQIKMMDLEEEFPKSTRGIFVVHISFLGGLAQIVGVTGEMGAMEIISLWN